MTDDQDPDRPTDEDKVHALQHDYVELAHALQTACEYGGGGMTGQPPAPLNGDGLRDWEVQKHLRVGVNAALLGMGALAQLLVKSGVITELDYWTAIVQEQRASVASEEAALAKRFGCQVKLA